MRSTLWRTANAVPVPWFPPQRKLQSSPNLYGRIDYLGTDGKVGESIEYTSPYSFEKDIKEENYYGVPMSIVPV